LRIYQGDDFYLDLHVMNPDTTDADLSGYTASASIKLLPNTPPVVSFEVMVDLTYSVVHLHLLAADTLSITESMVWDCQLTTDSSVMTIAAGKVSPMSQVTVG
jgi:hypothetical protein